MNIKIAILAVIFFTAVLVDSRLFDISEEDELERFRVN